MLQNSEGLLESSSKPNKQLPTTLEEPKATEVLADNMQS